MNYSESSSKVQCVRQWYIEGLMGSLEGQWTLVQCSHFWKKCQCRVKMCLYSRVATDFSSLLADEGSFIKFSCFGMMQWKTLCLSPLCIRALSWNKYSSFLRGEFTKSSRLGEDWKHCQLGNYWEEELTDILMVIVLLSWSMHKP